MPEGLRRGKRKTHRYRGKKGLSCGKTGQTPLIYRGRKVASNTGKKKKGAG